MKSFAAVPAGVSSAVMIALFSLPLVAAADGPLSMKKGSGGSEVQGSAGPGGSQGDNGNEKCDKPMGAMAVVEPQDYVSQSLSRYGLQSPTGIIRMMIQQSNCFIVVELKAVERLLDIHPLVWFVNRDRIDSILLVGICGLVLLLGLLLNSTNWAIFFAVMAVLGMILSGCAFALAHEAPGLNGNGAAATTLLLVVYAGMGVAFAWLYRRTGTLWAPIAAHALNNALALGAMQLAGG